MRGRVDAEGAAGDRRSSPARPAGGRARRRRARRRRSTPATRRSPPSGRRARPAAPAPRTHSATRRHQGQRPVGLVAVGRRARRPTARVRACSGSAGHSSSSGTTSRAPQRSARAQVGRGSRPARPARRPAPDARPAPRPDRSRRTASTGPTCVDEAPEVDRAGLDARLSHARARRTAGCAAPGARAGLLQVLVERHAAARCSRMPSASATSSGPGTVRPARSASVQATRSTRSKPRTDSAPALQRPLGQPQRRPGHRPALAQQPAGHLAVDRQPGARQPLRPRPPGPPRPGAATTAVDSGAPSPSSQAARVTGGRSTRRSIRSSSGPGQPRTGSAAAPAGCTCRRCRRRRSRTGRGWPPAPAAPGTGRSPSPPPGGSSPPALQRLPEGVEHRPGELGRLVQEQHAAVGPAQRARPDLPRPAADQRGHRGRVVRRLERSAG